MPKAIKTLVRLTIEDLVTDFLAYDRKEDEELRRGDIEAAVEAGSLSIEWMVEVFKKNLTRQLKP